MDRGMEMKERERVRDSSEFHRSTVISNPHFIFIALRIPSTLSYHRKLMFAGYIGIQLWLLTKVDNREKQSLLELI